MARVRAFLEHQSDDVIPTQSVGMRVRTHSHAPRGSEESQMICVKTTRPEETLHFAQKWASQLKRGDVVGLVGPLGSGKTLFVKGVAKGLGVEELVNSPTFVFVTEYQGKFPIYHMDLYRIDKTDQIETIGFEEHLDEQGITFIEWAEKVEELLPKKTIWVRFEIVGEKKRKIEIASPRHSPSASPRGEWRGSQ